MATITVDQQRLVLNSFAAIFQNNLVSKDLVTWKKFNGEMNDRNGLTVVEQVTPDYTTTFTTSVVNDLSAGVQDSTFGSEQYKLTQVIGSSMGWADFIKIRDIGEARESQALRKAAIRLATDIDSYIMRYCTLASNNWVGNVNGTNSLSTFADMAAAVTRLKKEGVEDDIRAVLSYDDWQALGTYLSTNSGGTPVLGDQSFRSGYTGTIAGVSTIFTQQLPSFTVGTRSATGALTAGTAESATTYASVCISAAPGQFMTQTLSVGSLGASATVLDGEVFTIAGVYAYDNRAKKALAHLQQFRVVGNATASGGGAATLRVFPAIITSGPYQTVAQAAGNTAVITFQGGAASSVTTPRFLANKDAIVVHTADLITPATGTSMRKALTKVPVSVRMWQDSKFDTGEHRIRFDIALEANVAADGRRRIVRVNGA
jgi:hypothetical protein